MRTIWILAANDLRVFLKDKIGYIWLFGMPIVFIYFFGTAMRFDNSEPSSPKPKLVIDNQDQGFIGALLVQQLEQEGVRAIGKEASNEKDPIVEIPDDFTQRVLEAKSVDVNLIEKPSGNLEPSAMIEVRLTRSIIALSSAIFAVVTDDTVEGEPEITETALKAMLERERKVALDVSFAGRRKVPSGFQQSVPGYVVMFILMNLLIFGSLGISSERTAGALRRIAVNPVKRWQIVIGKILGRFFLGAVQIVYLLVVSWLLFRVDYGDHIPTIGVTLLIFAWGCAALGVLVAAVIRTPETAQGVCTLGSILLAAIGGCWWPLEIMPDFAKQIAQLTPTAWAMSAMHQLISFGGSIADIHVELGLMGAFAAINTLLAAKFLRIE